MGKRGGTGGGSGEPASGGERERDGGLRPVHDGLRAGSESPCQTALRGAVVCDPPADAWAMVGLADVLGRLRRDHVPDLPPRLRPPGGGEWGVPSPVRVPVV